MPTAHPVRDADVVVLDTSYRRRTEQRRWPLLVVAAALFAIAYENGGYGLSTRSILAISLWWAVILGVALGLFPRAPLPRAARAVAMLLAAFALWTLISMAWAPSPELAFIEFNRSSLYLALFLVVAGTGGRRHLGWWLDGLRLGIVAVAVVALVSRLFPGVFPTRDIATFLPNAATRLSFPVGYWNGLAVLSALALPLAYGAALSAASPLRRALAVAPVPLLAAVVVLASSRGGVLAALIGTIVFIASTDRRWSAVAVVCIGAIGSIFAVIALRTHSTLLDGPLGGGVAEREGRVVAALLIVIAALTGALLPLSERVWGERSAPSQRFGRACVIGACVAIVGFVAFAHPLRRFDEFRRIPAAGQTAPNFATAHLISGSGSGRWQFWSAAVHEWESAPLIGRGAGTYRFWWAEHASFTYSLQNAHSLYLEVLGELGLIGLLLLVAAFGWGAVAVVRGLRSTSGEHRQALAALTGVFGAFVVCAGIDWLWQLTVVGGVGIAALALAASSAEPAEPGTRPARAGRSRLAFGAIGLLAVWAAVCAQAVPWLTAARISDSQSAARRGDLARALKDAQDARAIQPWAATPYLQMALVAEARGDLSAAVRWVHGATSRDSRDWAAWYVAARIEREAGNQAAGQAAFRRSKSLNIRSPIFAGGAG